MIVYSKITLTNGTIYSMVKGYAIVRRGDTCIVKTQAYERVIHVPWSAILEADFVREEPGK